MIVSASYRTDIPAFYGAWFARRWREGFAIVANPYGGKPSRVELRLGVDGFVFWTRNAQPFLPILAGLRLAGVACQFQYSLTGYPRALEAAVPDAERSIGMIRALAKSLGLGAVVWRYDPILLTGLTETGFHRQNFAALAAALEGAVDEVVVSFAMIYRKSRRNLDAAGKRHGFAWREPSFEEKAALLRELSGIAAGRGMRLTLCTQPELAALGFEAARCIDADRLSALAGRPIAARPAGNRPGCLCAESRDIGAYDGCPQGCAVCYAVSAQSTARRRLKAHDPSAEML